MTERRTINLNDPEFKRRLQTIRHTRPVKLDTDAYVYAGMWVADCPYPSCANAEALDVEARKFYCRECHYIADVNWPADKEAIDMVLSVRPVRGTRNWAPAGHRQAIACGYANGQTVHDLLEENEENL